jgi:hypothetical protein
MDLSNYVDVPTRFAMALERWPELRLVENRPEIITIGDKVFIAVTVQAWRTPDDDPGTKYGMGNFPWGHAVY